MNRLALLAVLAALLAAGCVGGPSASDPTASPDPLPDRTLSLPDGPKEAPAHPAAPNESTVRGYVREFQYRYAYNGLWYGEHTEVTLDCTVESVAAHRQGYNATVSCTGYSNTGGPAGNGTATEIHADYFTQTYVYYVDEDSTLRTGDGQAPDGWRPAATPTDRPTLTG